MFLFFVKPTWFWLLFILFQTLYFYNFSICSFEFCSLMTNNFLFLLQKWNQLSRFQRNIVYLGLSAVILIGIFVYVSSKNVIVQDEDYNVSNNIQDTSKHKVSNKTKNNYRFSTPFYEVSILLFAFFYLFTQTNEKVINDNLIEH